MSRAQLSFAAGVVLGLGAALASCGPTQPVSTDTTAFAVVFFNPDNGTRGLFFVGRDADGLDVFTRSYRPEALSQTPLPSPQKVRIFLSSDRPFTLQVTGVDQNSGEVEYGETAVTPVANDEVPVEVRLTKLETDAGTGGGSGSDGGMDGGTGGGPACGCDGGCCAPNGTCAMAGQAQVSIGTLRVTPCGNAAEACTSVCDTYRGNGQCAASGACECSSDNVCPAGTRCSGGQCVCDAASGCLGCCGYDAFVGRVTCKTGNRVDLSGCGMAGLSCDQCPVSTNGTGGCQQGVCGRTGADDCAAKCPDLSKCCSGTGCHDVQFPTCRMPTGSMALPAGVCIPCDVLRSNHCMSQGGCACGTHPGACPFDSLCVKALPDAGFDCVRVY